VHCDIRQQQEDRVHRFVLAVLLWATALLLAYHQFQTLPGRASDGLDLAATVPGMLAVLSSSDTLPAASALLCGAAKFVIVLVFC
jgi:hypothetical protein